MTMEEAIKKQYDALVEAWEDKNEGDATVHDYLYRIVVVLTIGPNSATVFKSDAFEHWQFEDEVLEVVRACYESGICSVKEIKTTIEIERSERDED